jgi:hypothetical protein
MAKTWDAVNDKGPPPVGFSTIYQLRQTVEAPLLCCAATRGHAIAWLDCLGHDGAGHWSDGAGESFPGDE